MAIEVKKYIEEKLRALPLGHPDRRFLEEESIRFAAHNSYREFMQSPEGLRSERETQAQNLARLFAKELGMSELKYIESLPHFFPQPEAYKGRFDIPVIVETRFPLARVAEILGITTYYDANTTRDWEGSKIATPKVPYTTWLHDGTPNLGKSVELVRNSLREDERGGTPYDGFGLYARDRSILDRYSLDFPGSVVEPDSAPYLYLFNGKPKLNHVFVGRSNRRFGSVVAGVEIRT